MTRFFVTGTDTGVGKTEISAALLSAMARRQLRPFAFKPFESGGTGDADTLREAAGGWQALGSVCLYRLRRPLAPAIAARLERRSVDVTRVLRHFSRLGPGAGVVEGAGGLFVPLTPRVDVIDLAARLALPVVLVARAGLGTINHTTLSLQALATRGLEVAAVVLSQGVRVADPSVPWNRAELERRFPRVRFLGPAPFVRARRARRAMLEALVAPLL
ncbi:MAG: dethiobiotin synthase [Myxococcota bacterium]